METKARLSDAMGDQLDLLLLVLWMEEGHASGGMQGAARIWKPEEITSSLENPEKGTALVNTLLLA